jgi:hypothetical protein
MNDQPRQQFLSRPLSIKEIGLSMAVLSELAIKLIYNVSEIGASEISRELRLPFAGVIQLILELLDREEMVNIIGAEGCGERAYRYTITRKGIERVHQVLERNQYVGPAPVPLEHYYAMIRAQAVGEVSLEEAEVQAAFEGLVIDPNMFDKIGPARAWRTARCWGNWNPRASAPSFRRNWLWLASTCRPKFS